MQLRLARALHLLGDNAGLTGLALDLGFSSHSHFSAAFKRAYGQTPSAFQRSRSRSLSFSANRRQLLKILTAALVVLRFLRFDRNGPLAENEMNQAEKAVRFAEFHVKGTPLLLYNAWDAGSAKAILEAGARAIATSSWSVAEAQGYRDGEAIPIEVVEHIIARIAATPRQPCERGLRRRL